MQYKVGDIHHPSNDGIDYVCCQSADLRGYRCTMRPNHAPDDHIATDTVGKILAMWPSAEAEK